MSPAVVAIRTWSRASFKITLQGFADATAANGSTAQAMPLTWGEGDIWHGELQAQSGCALISNFDRGPCTEQQLHKWHELGWLAQRSVA
jgi:hypothetical protein